MKASDEKSFFFIEGTSSSTEASAHPSWSSGDGGNVINAFHWYDGLSLFTKSFRSWFNVNIDTQKPIIGKRNVLKYFKECLAKAISHTKEKMGDIPCLLGEFGLAFDLNNKKGFKTGDYSLHEKALAMYYDAIDANLLHSAIWNYTASNTNKYGDGWNDEDLSIFSEGKERAAAGWKRPYPMATAGQLLSFNWNRKKGDFIIRFNADNKITSPTIVYLPEETFGAAAKVSVTAGLRWEYKHEEQRLEVYNDNYSGEAEIRVRLK